MQTSSALTPPEPRSPTLALAIPTYSRPETVAANLAAMAADARRLKIRVYLSDDSPDDRTADIVAGYADFVTYRRNFPGRGHDANVLETLLWPDADYVWLLGDALHPLDGVLESLQAFLVGQDLVFVNVNAPEGPDVVAARAELGSRLVRELAWHQALTGATIYSRKVIAWALATKPPVFRNFPQLSVILGYCAQKDAKIAWWGSRCVVAQKKGESYWRARALDVFVDDWGRLISNFSVLFGLDHLPAVIRSHSEQTNLFSASFLARLRLNGTFGFKDLDRSYFRAAVHATRWATLAALVFPRCVIFLGRLRAFARQFKAALRT